MSKQKLKTEYLSTVSIYCIIAACEMSGLISLKKSFSTIVGLWKFLLIWSYVYYTGSVNCYRNLEANFHPCKVTSLQIH